MATMQADFLTQPTNENIKYLGTYCADILHFGPNIVLHRAINNLIKNIGKIQNGHHAGRFSPRLKTLLISESIWQIYFIFVKNVDIPRAITIRI